MPTKECQVLQFIHINPMQSNYAHHHKLLQKYSIKREPFVLYQSEISTGYLGGVSLKLLIYFWNRRGFSEN